MVEMNDDVKELFLGRDGPVLLHENRLKTLRKIYDSDGDLVPVESSKRLSLEYDWKRNRSGPPELLTLGESHHVAFDTGPWEDATQFEQRRESQEHWRKAGGGAIKALEDLQAFEEYCAGAPAVSRGLRRSMRGGAIALAKRQFLRAFVRGEWGLDNIQSSYRDISDWLTSGGYQCTVDDLKNAKRGDARLETNVVPLTSTTEAFVEYVKGRFHSFNVCAFFVSEAASISA